MTKKRTPKSALCRLCTCFLLIMGGGIGLNAHAELLVYEGFDYPMGNVTSPGTALNGGYGWAKDSYWHYTNSKHFEYKVTLGSYSTGNGSVVTGNKISIKGNSANAATRSLKKTIDSSLSKVVWGSVLMKGNKVYDSYRLHFYLASGSSNALYIYANPVSGETIKIGGGNATAVDTGVSCGTTDLHFFIYKIDFTEDVPVAKVWRNPGDLSSEEALGTPIATLSDVGSSLTGVKLMSCLSNPACYDEIRIGTTLADAWKSLPPHGFKIYVR